MSTQILGFFNDFSLNRAKGQVGHWCIYTNTCTWATQKRIRLTSICGTWVQDGAYPKQGVVFCFCFIFSSEYFSFTFFSHVPCDYQNLFFGLNAFWYFITWLHSKLSELTAKSTVDKQGTSPQMVWDGEEDCECLWFVIFLLLHVAHPILMQAEPGGPLSYQTYSTRALSLLNALLNYMSFSFSKL